MKQKSQCEACEIRGYSPEICKIHLNKAAKKGHDVCPHQNPIKKIAKNAAIGAGVGAMAMFLGLAAVPAAAIKAVFGHVMAVKVSAGAGGGVAGAGYNIFRKTKKTKPKPKQTRLPLIV
ncbi:MAG: hypothetical protein HQK79_11320 [Desulfobacterales bacterium]|nr:hypothetical protein [Desulfobacterales bacterium]